MDHDDDWEDGGAIELPEFRVTLTRLAPGEPAYPSSEGADRHDVLGQRTKLGGKPDWHQGERDNPACPECTAPMTFVAQIDSIEHDWPSNPHRQDSSSDDQKWMFGDVGLIYVFFCTECLQAHAEFECA